MVELRVARTAYRADDLAGLVEWGFGIRQLLVLWPQLILVLWPQLLKFSIVKIYISISHPFHWFHKACLHLWNSVSTKISHQDSLTLANFFHMFIHQLIHIRLVKYVHLFLSSQLHYLVLARFVETDFYDVMFCVFQLSRFLFRQPRKNH